MSIMYANNETGTVFPVDDIARIVKERGALLHVDAVQAVGKEPIDLSRTPIDFLALSGHKLHAPKGVGVLYVRKGTRFRPFLRGGHQRRWKTWRGRKMCRISWGWARPASLPDLPWHRSARRWRPCATSWNVVCLRPSPTRLSTAMWNTDCPIRPVLPFESVEGEAILLMLNEFGICASSGSACTSGSLEPSHVLRAMGVPFTYAHGSIRFSLSRYTTEAEIDKVLEVMPGVIKTLREISPFTRRG